MKKNSKILALLLAVAFIAFCTVSTRESKVVQAFDTEASYITIKNSTAFTLENIHVTYNGDKELEVGDIRTSSSETAEILPDDRQITEVKISGEIFNGRKFSSRIFKMRKLWKKSDRWSKCRREIFMKDWHGE